MTYFKRLTVIMLVVAMILGTAGIAGAAPSDVVGQPCEEAVDYLMDLGIVAGYPDGTFQPARTLTRAEVAKIIVLAHLGAQGETLAGYLKGAYSFPDVPATHWASGYIKLAQNLGIVDGYPDNTFRPLQAVTHIELVKMLLEAANVAPGAGTWPTNYLTPGLAEGIVVEGLGVNEPITRCDMAEMTAHTIANVVNPITGKTLAQSVFGESMVATLTVAPVASTVAIGAAVQFVATAKDADGAIVSDVGIEFTTDDPAKSAINTAGLFVASASGHYTVTATIGTVEAEAMVHVFGAATALMATPETTTVTANGESTVTITVAVVDANGITVTNDDDTEITIGYADDGDNGGVDLPADAADITVTVDNGVATFEVTATANADVTDILEFTADDEDIDEDTAEVTTVEQVATAIGVEADPEELMANEIDDGTVTATVLDQDGEDMLTGTYELTFSITGKGTLDGDTDSVTEAASPSATLPVASEKGDPGTFTITVTGEGLASGSVTVSTYIAGSPVALKVTVDEDTTEANGEDELSITVGLVDKWGHWTISDTDTVLEFDYDDDADFCGCLNGTIWAGDARTGDIDFSGYTAGTWTITVTDADDDYTAASFDVTVVAGEAAKIGYEPDEYDDTDLWLPITNPTMTFTVQLYDAYDNEVAAADEEIEVWLTGARSAYINGEEVDPGDFVVVETDSTGVATVVFKAQAYVDEMPGYYLDFVYGDWDAHMSTIYVTDTLPGSISIATYNEFDENITTIAADAGQTVWVIVEVDDTNGNAMNKATELEITFSNDGDNVQMVTLDEGSDDGIYLGTTDGDGVLVFTFEGAKAGSFTITAKALQTSSSVTKTKSFRTKTGTVIADALIFNADGTLADEVDFDDNVPVALKLSLVDNGGNVMVAAEDTDVLLVPAEGGEYRETASGTGVSVVTIDAGKTYKTIYFVSDVDGEDVNLSDDAIWPIEI